MISELSIRGFKRFRDESFQLAPLTILAGLNGSGKTSLIQSLLLMHEASRSDASSLRLNGPFDLELGTAADVCNWSSNDILEFKATDSNGKIHMCKLEAPSEEALYLNVVERPRSGIELFDGTPRSFTYLCAERLGPRTSALSSALPDEELEVGVRGAYCAQLLATAGSKPVDRERLIPERVQSEPSLLKYEVEYWLSEVSRPVEVDATWSPSSLTTELRFRSPGGEWVRAPNMGFGVSYALPVILAGLIAKPGGILIVENPEAHLHPAGQSRMGVFLAWIASIGVQVVAETHSDHVVNGIRRAVGEYKYLSHDEAVVQFFASLDTSASQRLEFNPIGGISHWPTGFFDQYQIDVQALGRIRRGAN